MKPDFRVTIKTLTLQNPVMVASGTFGYAEEFGAFMDLKSLGAVVTKTITLCPRQGNIPPRTCETPAGMLNSIGLENPGIEVFIREKLPQLKKIGVPVIVSVASEKNPDEFLALIEALDPFKEVAALELNISCPNLKHAIGKKSDAHLIAQDPEATYALVKSIRRATRKPLITKLSPNVTCISTVALAAERAGSDAVSLINTLMGLSVDVGRRIPKIAMGVAGLSGPAIRPVAVKMVWETYRKIKIPIIGMGGITDVASALEFIIAGASAISVGTANFVNPRAAEEIIGGISRYMMKNKIRNLKTLKGSLKL